jgi:hypothetical protein
MSLEEGIRGSSTTSTETIQPSWPGSTPVTPSGCLPVSSAICSSPALAACAALSRPRCPCCLASPASLSPI